MIRVEEARRLILENTFELGKENVNIRECLDSVSAEDIFSETDIPPFNNAAMDGYAVASAALKGASPGKPAVLKLEEKLPAGYTTGRTVTGNSAVQIMTGAPVPAGADAVVQIEHTQQEGMQVKVFGETGKGKNIRLAGEDIKKGQMVIPKGKTLGPSDIGMLAALNIGSVRVIKKPMVSLLSTGDELAEPGETLLPGKIRNINGYSLYAQILKYGGKPQNLGVARDTREELKIKLENGKNSDILVITGGISAGDYDYVRSVLLSMGMEEKFWKVAMKPGKPALFGLIGRTLAFGLPGNPVAAMVSFNQFVLPAIYKMQGKSRKPWKEVKAVLEGDIEKKPGFLNLIRAKATCRDGNVYVKPFGNQSSGAFSSMVFSDCLIIMNEETTKIRNGEEVLIQVMDGIGEYKDDTCCFDCR